MLLASVCLMLAFLAVAWATRRIVVPRAGCPRGLRVCVLVLSVGSGGRGEPEKVARWRSEKRIWRRYMWAHPCVTCRFIECGTGDEEDTIFCDCTEQSTLDTDLWIKTGLAAAQVRMASFDYCVRPNLNMFLVFDHLFAYLNSFPYDPTLHTGGKTLGTYASGSCLVLGRECASALTTHSFVESNVCSSIEDVCLGQFLEDAGFPMKEQDPPICYEWDERRSHEANVEAIDERRLPFVRTKGIEDQEAVQNALVDRYYPPALPP